MTRDNELILLQMRKAGYDRHNLSPKVGLVVADRAYAFLEQLQSLYDAGCLKGNFHSDNIIVELWNLVKNSEDPLGIIDNDFYSFNDILSMAVQYKS